MSSSHKGVSALLSLEAAAGAEGGIGEGADKVSFRALMEGAGVGDLGLELSICVVVGVGLLGLEVMMSCSPRVIGIEERVPVVSGSGLGGYPYLTAVC